MRLANTDGFSEKRNALYPSLEYEWAQGAISITSGLGYHADKGDKVTEIEAGNRRIVCIETTEIVLLGKACIDAQTGIPVVWYDAVLNLQFE